MTNTIVATLGYKTGDPTWFNAFLILGAIAVAAVGIGWLVIRSRRKL